MELPLVRYHAVRTSPQPKQSLAIGAPVLLEYDTSRASIYPREGMFLPATAIYRRVQNQPHLSFIAADNRITLGRKLSARYRQKRGRFDARPPGASRRAERLNQPCNRLVKPLCATRRARRASIEAAAFLSVTSG